MTIRDLAAELMLKRPTEQELSPVVTNEDGAPLGIDWKTLVETGLIK